ncbi:MAG TPA: peptidylprolyl isomerase [Bacilli bacterium]|nr:peptidylprolyl isomerase [Bacilli bacterium]
MKNNKKNAKKEKKVINVKVTKPREKKHIIKNFMSNLTLEQITMIGLGIIILLLVIIAIISNIKPTIKNGEQIVAKVSGNTITADELYNSLSSKYGRDLLIDTIDNIILNKLYKTTSEMEASAEATIEQYKSTYGDQFEAFLEYNGIYGGEDEFKIALIKNTKISTVVDEYIKDLITEPEMKAYYEESIYGDIKASHILIKFTTTDSSTDDEVKADQARALAKAKEIITELKGGADFATLAKKYSEDTSNASSGGDLGYFNTGTMEETFEQAALKLSVNSYTKTPVKTTYGYHIILKTGQKDKPTYAKSKETIIEKLVAQYKATDTKMTYKALINMRKTNKLKIYDPVLKKAYDTYMNELLNSTTTNSTTLAQ